MGCFGKWFVGVISWKCVFWVKTAIFSQKTVIFGSKTDILAQKQRFSTFHAFSRLFTPIPNSLHFQRLRSKHKLPPNQQPNLNAVPQHACAMDERRHSSPRFNSVRHFQRDFDRPAVGYSHGTTVRYDERRRNAKNEHREIGE